MNILIIENEHKVSQALKKNLTQEGYGVDVVFDGDEGQKFAIGGKHDLLIVDRSLPNKDGLSIVKAMRSSNIHTPVIVLTTKSNGKERASVLDSGADDFIVKPFAIGELLVKIRALLRKPGEIQETVLNCGDLSLNTATYEVKRGATNITLTGKEFALLEFLMRHQNRPNNKEIIISHVWDYNADVLPNTVEVYVKYLRQKIDDPFKVKLLQTARGFGYNLSSK